MDTLRTDRTTSLWRPYFSIERSAWPVGRDAPDAEVVIAETAKAKGDCLDHFRVSEAEVELSLEQAAPLFRSVQIPIVVAQRIRHRSDFRKLLLQYPCHLRGPEGSGLGIVVTNRIDAIAACQTLMSRKVNGAFPEYLLVEEDCSTKRQLGLSVDLDESSGELYLWASATRAFGQDLTSGNIVETTQTFRLAELSTEAGLAFARKLGLDPAEQAGLACMLEKLYILMTWVGLTRCCLDSLVVGQIGEAIALRGQVTFSPGSPFRQQAAAAQQSGEAIRPERRFHSGLPTARPVSEAREGDESRSVDEAKCASEAKEAKSIQGIAAKSGIESAAPTLVKAHLEDHCLPPRVVRLGEGNIAVVSNGFDRTMATLEQFQLQGDSAAAFVSLSERIEKDDLEQDVLGQQRQLCQALQALARLPRIKVLLINWRSAHYPCRLVADTLVEYKQQLSRQGRRSAPPLSLVVRLVGEGAKAGYQRLQGEEIVVEENLGGAIACSLGLARIGHG